MRSHLPFSTREVLATISSPLRACLDPKGGELCLNKVKPGETRVEACSGADVQIARMIWVSERKTHRTT